MATRILVVAAPLVLLLSCRRHELPAEPPRAVRVQRLEQVAAATGLRYSASLAPDAQVVLAFRVGGYVDRIEQRRGPDGELRNMQAGDVVRRGEPLARVREADYRQKVAEARARHEAAKATLERAVADFDRAKGLFDAASLTRPDYDKAKNSLDSARQNVKGTAAAVDAAELSLSDCVLRAPSDGVILKRSIDLGALAAPGTPGFTFAELDRMKAVFGVPEQVVARLSLGTELQVRLAATDAGAGDGVRGRITSISPAADPTSRVFTVEVTVPNRGRKIRPGSIATIEVPGQGTASPAFSVPLSAVVRGPKGEGYAVYVVEKQEGRWVARIRAVRLGDIVGNGITVLGGLEGGEPVVTSGGTRLVDGMAIQVLE